MSANPFYAKMRAIRQDAEIATLRERLAEMTRIKDDAVERLEASEESLSVCRRNCEEASRRTYAAEAANKRLRAETIEECAKKVEEGIDIIGALPYSSIWSALKGAADHVRALASKEGGK